ncbi:hypothetical protein BANORC5_24670 [Bacteroides nordii]|nr:hypothetical protein BANORC5_24670 [Bacteroides nordii]
MDDGKFSLNKENADIDKLKYPQMPNGTQTNFYPVYFIITLVLLIPADVTTCTIYVPSIQLEYDNV